MRRGQQLAWNTDLIQASKTKIQSSDYQPGAYVSQRPYCTTEDRILATAAVSHYLLQRKHANGEVKQSQVLGTRRTQLQFSKDSHVIPRGPVLPLLTWVILPFSTLCNFPCVLTRIVPEHGAQDQVHGEQITFERKGSAINISIWGPTLLSLKWMSGELSTRKAKLFVNISLEQFCPQAPHLKNVPACLFVYFQIVMPGVNLCLTNSVFLPLSNWTHCDQHSPSLTTTDCCHSSSHWSSSIKDSKRVSWWNCSRRSLASGFSCAAYSPHQLPTRTSAVNAGTEVWDQKLILMTSHAVQSLTTSLRR